MLCQQAHALFFGVSFSPALRREVLESGEDEEGPVPGVLSLGTQAAGLGTGFIS